MSTPNRIYKARVVGEEVSVTYPSKQLLDDPFSAVPGYGDVLMMPPYSLEQLVVLAEKHPVHGAALEQKAMDVVGKDIIYEPLVEDADPEQRDDIQRWLEGLPELETLVEVLHSMQLDYHTTGWGLLEVARDPNGVVRRIYHVPAHTVRATRDNTKLVQVRGGRAVWFKRWGAGLEDVPILAANGRRASSDTSFDKLANEMLVFRKSSRRSTWYGVPNYVSALGHIALAIAARDYNVQFFCLSDDTEVLTRDGWRRHDQVTDSTEYATFNMETGALEYQRARGVARHYFDTMLHIGGESSRRFDLLVSADHSLVVDAPGGGWRKITAREFANCCRKAKMPAAGLYTGNGKSDVTVAEAALLGWIITDGSFVRSGREIKTFSIGQNEGLKADKIRKLLSEAGIAYTEHTRISASGKRCVGFYAKVQPESRRLVELLKGEKLIPQALQEASVPVRRALLDALVDGDGSRNKWGGMTFCQKDKRLIDQVQQLAIGLGMNANVRPQPSRNGVWYMSIVPRGYITTAQRPFTKVEEVPYGRIAWCPSVPNGTLVVRRNGRAVVVGNSNAREPRYVFVVSGLDGQEEEIEALMDELEQSLKVQHAEPHRNLIIPLTGERAQLKIERITAIQNDMHFTRLMELTEKDILIAHRMPPDRVGSVVRGFLGGNVAASINRIYKDAVVAAEQHVLKDRLNRFVRVEYARARGIRPEDVQWGVSFETLDLSDETVDTMNVLNRVKSNAITLNEARSMWGLPARDGMDVTLAEWLAEKGKGSAVAEALQSDTDTRLDAMSRTQEAIMARMEQLDEMITDLLLNEGKEEEEPWGPELR